MPRLDRASRTPPPPGNHSRLWNTETLGLNRANDGGLFGATDLPVGLIFRNRVKPSEQKYLSSVFRKTMLISHPSRARQEGVSRSSRNVVRDVVDAITSSDVRWGSRTVKSCGPDSPTLESTLGVTSLGEWWLKSPVHQGEHEAAVKTIAQGMPVVSAALSLLACAKCTFLCTQGSRVRPASGIPCPL